jgi:ferritin-like metal-binding protein YciE
MNTEPLSPITQEKGAPFMAIKNLRDLWLDELKDLYNAEKQILVALPKMAKAASEDNLRQAFEDHLEQTHGHVDRLEEIFKSIDEPVRGKKCKGMEGIIGEGKEMLEEDLPETVCDAALIAAAQRVEHYEIAAYGTVRAYAELLGESDAMTLLEQTLAEEKETDERLTSLAEQINPEAEEGDTDDAAPRANGKRRQMAGARR